MTEQFNGKYGFRAADEICTEECQDNRLILPRLYRYIGMGYYQILAEVRGVPDKFFLIDVGGSNGYESDFNHKELRKIAVKDAITIEQVQAKLKGQSWVEIVSTTKFEGGQINETKRHNDLIENP